MFQIILIAYVEYVKLFNCIGNGEYVKKKESHERPFNSIKKQPRERTSLLTL